MADFTQLMNNGFGVVTVMDVCIYEKKGGYGEGSDCCAVLPAGQTAVTGEPYDASSWVATGQKLDTLKISNLNQEGPTKTITGGKYSVPLVKYGKTTTVEMQDALGSAMTLVRFFGCELGTSTNKGARISVGDKFPHPFAMEGKTFFIDRVTGKEVELYIFMPQFYPEGILNLTQDAEGDAAVFDLNGTLISTWICDDVATESTAHTKRKVAYEIREKSFFAATPTADSSDSAFNPADYQFANS